MIIQKSRLLFWGMSSGARNFASQPLKKRVVIQEERDLIQHQRALQLIKEQNKTVIDAANKQTEAVNKQTDKQFKGAIISGLLQGMGLTFAVLIGLLYILDEDKNQQRKINKTNQKDNTPSEAISLEACPVCETDALAKKTCGDLPYGPQRDQCVSDIFLAAIQDLSSKYDKDTDEKINQSIRVLNKKNR